MFFAIPPAVFRANTFCTDLQEDDVTPITFTSQSAQLKNSTSRIRLAEHKNLRSRCSNSCPPCQHPPVCSALIKALPDLKLVLPWSNVMGVMSQEGRLLHVQYMHDHFPPRPFTDGEFPEVRQSNWESCRGWLCFLITVGGGTSDVPGRSCAGTALWAPASEQHCQIHHNHLHRAAKDVCPAPQGPAEKPPHRHLPCPQVPAGSPVTAMAWQEAQDVSAYHSSSAEFLYINMLKTAVRNITDNTRGRQMYVDICRQSDLCWCRYNKNHYDTSYAKSFNSQNPTRSSKAGTLCQQQVHRSDVVLHRAKLQPWSAIKVERHKSKILLSAAVEMGQGSREACVSPSSLLLDYFCWFILSPWGMDVLKPFCWWRDLCNHEHSQCRTKNHSGEAPYGECIGWGTGACIQQISCDNAPCYRGPSTDTTGKCTWSQPPGAQIKWYIRAPQAKKRWEQGTVLTIKNSSEFKSDITQPLDQQHSFVFPAFKFLYHVNFTMLNLVPWEESLRVVQSCF